MKIGRTLFWFLDGREKFHALTEEFFALANLLNRLMNEIYDGKKIEFININLSTPKTYKEFPVLLKNAPHYYGGHLQFYGEMDLAAFNLLSKEKQSYFIWEKAFEYLQIAGKAIKNDTLLAASLYAYNKGLATELNPDYRLIEADVTLYGEELKAAVWVNFKDDGMYSKLTLQKNGRVVFEKHIDKTRNGIEVFLVMYKSIVVKDNTVIVKGRKDVDGLPWKVLIEESVIKA